jgi:hypothetical protein
VLGGVGDGVRVADPLELTDADQPVEEPGRVVVRDGIRDPVGNEVGSDPINLGWRGQD